MSNTNQQLRDCKYEFIRLIAIYFVLCNHTLSLIPNDGTLSRDLFLNLLFTFTGSCNALYFFISGRFALQKTLKTDEEYKTFYFKKALYLILPLVFYMMIHSFLSHYKETGSFNGLGIRIITDILCHHNGLHFWFMMFLTGNILIAPFMAKVFDGLSKTGAIIFVTLGILHNTLIAYTPYFANVSYNWVFPFAQWSIYFYIGVCIDKIITTKKEKNIAIIVGIISLIIITLKQYFFSYQQFSHDLMPSFTFFCIMFYLVLQEIDVNKWSEKVKSAIRFMGKRTYGIYLVHMLAIWLTIRICPNKWNIPDIPYHSIIVIVSFIVSLISSYLADLVIFNPIQKLCERIRNGKKKEN